jgi:hypothetical protein
MTTVEALESPDRLDPAPRAATERARPLLSEVTRLRHRRLVLAIVALGLVALLGALLVVFFTHSTDVEGARAEATEQAAQMSRDQAASRQQCLADPNIPDVDKQAGACGPEPGEPQAFFRDPRLRADVGLPGIAIGVAVGGALMAALIGATAVGADWSSRALITLLTWEPRRLRLLGRRYAAVAAVVAVLGVVFQAIGLGGGALIVSTRGTWQASPPPSQDDMYYQQPPLIGAGHLWRDLLSLQLRGVGLMVLVAILAAALTTVTRHTGGMLGIAFAWFAVVENAVRILFGSRGWPRWLLTENLAAYLTPGGQHMAVGTVVRDGGLMQRTVLVSNLDALLYLGVVTAVAALLAGLLLRRRDL